jgi:hypothetical protein
VAFGVGGQLGGLLLVVEGLDLVGDGEVLSATVRSAMRA